MTASFRTSETDPIAVDWLPPEAPGRIGLTIAPGKHSGSMSGSSWRRDLASDLDRLVSTHAATMLVSLVEDAELQSLKIPSLVQDARKRGLIVERLPLVDGAAPSDVGAIVELAAKIRAAAAVGAKVVIHCAAGLGRSGVVAGSVLIAGGKSAAEALAILKETRGPRCPENEAQRKFLKRVEEHVRRPTAAAAPSRRDRIAGGVLAAAIGDAMGHPTEFVKLPAIRERWGTAGVTKFELFWDRDGKRFAPYTDDTQMAEIVLRTLVESAAATRDLDATMKAMSAGFIEWSEHPQGGHRAPGNACLAGCKALARGVHWSEAGGESAGGCGSVMRAYPFGLVFADDLEQAEAWAVAHSKLTHRDPIALAACAAMAIGTALALNLAAPEIVVAAMIAAAHRYSVGTAEMMQGALDEAREGVAPDVTLTRLQSWAAHEAIAAAVYVFARHPDDPAAAILEGANTDGDSDSIATLAGALTGARCGLGRLPEDWVAQVERSTELQALAGRVASSG